MLNERQQLVEVRFGLTREASDERGAYRNARHALADSFD